MLKTVNELVSEARAGITVVDAGSAYQSGAGTNALFIDVREPAEAAEHPVPGSVNIPRGVLEMQMINNYNDHDLPLYVHCATGARACLAAEQLKRIGYTRVHAISCKLEVIRAAQEGSKT